MENSSQAVGLSFRTVYYVGSSAKFIACGMFPLMSIIVLVYLLKDPRELLDILFVWRTNLIGGLVDLAGFGLIAWMIAFGFWIPLRCFAFPKMTEGVFVATSVHEARKGRNPVLDITIGRRKLRAHCGSELLRVLETIPRGSQVRVTSGPRDLIVRIEAAS